MTLVKPIVELNNPPYTRSSHGTIRKFEICRLYHRDSGKY